MDDSVLDAEEMKAVAVLLRATMDVVSTDAAVVVCLQRLMREGTRSSYRAAQKTFDILPISVRQRIGDKAPGLVRRRVTSPNLPGLLRALNRGAGQSGPR